ncbi:MAG: tagatose 1,6-diphosphate aldolase [Actinomycetota bacterium]|nr:tagatose 1,6-diphosphate aldolase [Actinomycetota bacterium]
MPALPSGLGKIRRLDRISDAGGFIRVAAIDHPENYLALFDTDVSQVGFDEVVESKLELIDAMAPHCSALLLDPVYSIGQAILSGTATGSVGLISGVEKLSYAPADSPTGWGSELAVRDDWSVDALAALGVDGVKIVVFHRSDSGGVSDEQHATIQRLAVDCAAHELPLIVEPIWFPAPGEDLTNPAVQQLRSREIIGSARSFAECGADIMKVEFPWPLLGSVDDPNVGAAARDACAELDCALDVPWVLLSASVGFDAFADQMQIAAAAGASGFMAGRALWGDGVGRLPAEQRRRGAQTAADRLDRLAAIVGEYGRPARRRSSVAESIDLLDADWHHRYRR